MLRLGSSKNLRAMVRDLNDEARMNAWKYCVRNVSFSYRITREDEVFWMSQNARQAKLKDAMTMAHTCLQKMFSVLNHKSRYEKHHGDIRASVACYYPHRCQRFCPMLSLPIKNLPRCSGLLRAV